MITDAPISIPPFAAAVFVRAGSDPSRIVPELKGLREEMASVRQALAHLQQERDWGKYRDGFQTIFATQPSRDSEITADEQTRKALDKLSNLKVPLPPQLLKLQPLFSVVKGAASLLINLIGPSPSWPDGFKDVREMVEKTLEMKAWNDDYAFAEVHNRLGWNLRGFFPSKIRLENLFGKIRDDEPR